MAPHADQEMGSIAEQMAATTAEIVRELIEAHKKRKDVNLNKLKTKIGIWIFITIENSLIKANLKKF